MSLRTARMDLTGVVYACLALGIAGTQPVSAQEEVITDFRGYRWGTTADEIPELAEAEQSGERDGLAIYSHYVQLFGRTALAGYYFHPETGGLVEGAYIMVMELDECQAVWGLFTRDVQRTYPALERQGELPDRRNAHRPVYADDCEYFVYNVNNLEWRLGFGNPDPPRDEVRMWIRVNERSPRLHVVYRGADGKAWQERSR